MDNIYVDNNSSDDCRYTKYLGKHIVDIKANIEKMKEFLDYDEAQVKVAAKHFFSELEGCERELKARTCPVLERLKTLTK